LMGDTCTHRCSCTTLARCTPSRCMTAHHRRPRPSFRPRSTAAQAAKSRAEVSPSYRKYTFLPRCLTSRNVVGIMLTHERGSEERARGTRVLHQGRRHGHEPLREPVRAALPRGRGATRPERS
jgi:hypothetical protein